MRATFSLLAEQKEIAVIRKIVAVAKVILFIWVLWFTFLIKASIFVLW